MRSLRSKLLHRPTRREIVVIENGSDPGLHGELTEQGWEDADDVEPTTRGQAHDAVSKLPACGYTEEDEAAIKIQAVFRGHLV